MRTEVEPLVHLLGQAAARVIAVAAQLTGQAPERLAEDASVSRLLGELEWDDREEVRDTIGELCEQVDRLASWVGDVLAERSNEARLSEHLAALHELRTRLAEQVQGTAARDVARSDADLLSSWRNGDKDAGNELFERYSRQLYRFFRRRTQQGIDDLIQETFLACVQGRDKIGSFRAYMFGAATNVFRAHLRKLKSDGPVDFGVTSLQDLVPSPSKLVDAQNTNRLIEEAMRHIPFVYQEALLLYYYDGFRGPEIASILGAPEGTVRGRLRRGCTELRKHFKTRGLSAEVLAEILGRVDGWARAHET